MAGILGLIVKLFLQFWNGMKSPVIVTESEEVGQLKQALNTSEKTNADTQQVIQDRDTVKPLTIDELPKHNSSNDPDFRD